MAITDIVDRAAGYGMPGVIVDGMDVVAVHEAATEAVARARRGEGPSLIEAKTYRFYNHHGIQNLGLKYRTDDEVAEWKRARSDLHVRGAADRERHRHAANEIDGDLGRTARRHRHGDQVRRGQPGPDTRPVARRRVHRRGRAASAEHDPQADLRPGLQRGRAPGDGGRATTCSAPARTSAPSAACSRRTPVSKPSSANDRVVDTPISEQAIIGLGVGAAVTGLRPIVDIMFMDFMCVAFDQIVNQAAKLKYMFGGAATLRRSRSPPPAAAGCRPAAQHSQSPRGAALPHPRAQGRATRRTRTT